MSCCGKTIKKAGRIVKGYVALATGVKYEHTDDRIRECQQCNEQTWMSKVEYAEWLIKNGIKNPIAVLQLELEKLPKLPKYEQEKGRRNLFCRLCWCFIPAKAALEKEKCLLDKWDKE